MTEFFDPYHQWLGIPADEQPPSHYRLLAIPAFESDPAVIESAADRQMAHLRTYQAGKHAVESQRLLNEVAAARVCLLNPQRRAAYDERLRQQLAEASPLACVATSPSRPAASCARPAPAPRLSPAIRAAGAALGAAVIGCGLWWVIAHGAPTRGPASGKSRPLAAADMAKEPAAGIAPAAAKERPAAIAEATTPSRPEPPPVVPPSSPPEPAAAVKPPNEPQPVTRVPAAPPNAAAEKPAGDPAPAPAEKLHLPSKEEQQRLAHDVDTVYKPGEAKDRAAKATLARRLLEDGRKNEANRNEQFVMLRRAGEIARDAGDAELMLQAVDAMADAGFDFEPRKIKASWLGQVVAGEASPGDLKLTAAIAACVKFAEAAAAEGGMDEAVELLRAADKSLAEKRKAAAAAYRMAKASVLRARTPADRAARETKAADAKADLDAIEAARSTLAECHQGIERKRRAREEVLAAQERLKTAPDDPDACLLLGRWKCLGEDDWDAGLKLLAKGSDAALKSLAAEELAAQPAGAKPRVDRGDAWWDLAEKGDDKAKAALRRRAARWYREALPDLPPGLEKSKVQQRLAQVAERPSPADDVSSRLRPPMALAPFDEKTAKQHQARWAKYLGATVELTNSLGMKLVLIPPGEFDMGSPKELIDAELRAHGDDKWFTQRLPGELPRHRVRITRAFYLGIYEVTQGEYQRVMGKNPSEFAESGGGKDKVRGQDTQRFPVEMVSWDETGEFCRRLSALPEEMAAGRSYQLPSEAQWEYACRAGSPGRFGFSADRGGVAKEYDEHAFSDYGWCNANSGGKTHAVGGKRPNAWGLYDMHGNVWEWCHDWYDKDYYGKSPSDNPPGPAAGSDRVTRGGSWYRPAGNCPSAYRRSAGPGHRDNGQGLRLSLVLPEK